MAGHSTADRLVLVGTCSWTDTTLVKDTDWYPKKSMSAAERLAFYASRFSITEADSTYYFPPSPQLTKGWAERSPEGFTMNVKAYSLMTGHPAKPNSLWPDLREAIKPEFAGKRNVYLSHLAARRARGGMETIPPCPATARGGGKARRGPDAVSRSGSRPRRTTGRAGRHPGAVGRRARVRGVPIADLAGDAVRTGTAPWAPCATLSLALVVVDAPAASKLPTVVEVTTRDLAVVRFHGRNDETWKKAGTTAAERFRYLYSKPQLRAWVPSWRAWRTGPPRSTR